MRREEIELRPEARSLHFEEHRLHAHLGLIASREQYVRQGGATALVSGKGGAASFKGEGDQLALIAGKAFAAALPFGEQRAHFSGVCPEHFFPLRPRLLGG